jgi:hypothetical protein
MSLGRGDKAALGAERVLIHTFTELAMNAAIGRTKEIAVCKTVMKKINIVNARTISARIKAILRSWFLLTCGGRVFKNIEERL